MKIYASRSSMAERILEDETRYRVLKALEANPQLSQRQLAGELGISVGKTNYCLKALTDKGWVKLGNVQRSANKRAYSYLLTSQGIREKTRLTRRFLQRKRAEYEALEQEIEQLRAEVEDTRKAGS